MKYPKDYLGCANELPDSDKRHKVYIKQREQRGWDDTEIWNLDSTFYKFISTRLRVFKEKTISYPNGLTPKKWKAIIQSMIDDAEYLQENQFTNYENAAAYTLVYDRFFDNFKKYLPNLWD
jgi:hypothetical protein